MFFSFKIKKHVSNGLVAESPGVVWKSMLSMLLSEAGAATFPELASNVSFRTVFLFLSITFQPGRIVIDLGSRRLHV